MWKMTTLGEYYDVRDGTHNSPKYVEIGLPLVTSKNLKDGRIDLTKVKYISEDDYREINKRSGVDVGDVLMAMIGTIGNPVEIVEPVNFAIKNVALFKTNENQSPSYLRYFLNHPRTIEKMLADAKGATQKFVGLGYLRNFPIFVPPLAEQQRIVAKLDAAFERIDKAIETYSHNRDNSSYIYRYAIDELFNENVIKAEPIGNYSQIDYGHTTKASFEKGTYKFLRITDIQGGHVDWSRVPYCEVEDKKLEKVLLHDGDIVFARTGATTGKSFLVKTPLDAVFASYLIRVSINREKLLPSYVMHYFQSADYWRQVNEGISGAAQGGFNATKLKELKIPIISIEEQIGISNRLDRIALETKELSNVYRNKIELLASLKSAILAQELRGETA